MLHDETSHAPVKVLVLREDVTIVDLTSWLEL